MDMTLTKLQERVKGRKAWHATVHGVAKRLHWETEQWQRVEFLSWISLIWNFPFTFSAYITTFHSNCFFCEYSVASLLKGKHIVVYSYIFYTCLQWLYSSLAAIHSQGELPAFWISTVYYKVTSHKYSTFLDYKRYRYRTIMRQVHYALWQKCMFSSSPRKIAAN